MNILICDDMRHEADKLSELLAASGYEINMVVYTNASDALAFIRSGKIIDVCFLDIIMPDMLGVELAAQLRKDGYKGQIVFLSSSREYGPEVVGVKAFLYLLKPPTAESVHKTLCELVDAKKDSDTGGVLVKSVGITRFVLFREISHIEVMRHNVHYRLTDGTALTARVSLTEISPLLLSDGRFVQCHRSFIINLDAVAAVQGNDFIMRCGSIVSNTKSYPGAKERYIEWALGGTEK